MLEYRLLGPVQVYDDGRLIEAGPPRQRLVLAALLVDAGEVVGWDTLVDRVWGERTPVDARGSMRAHITRIRQVLQHLLVPERPAGRAPLAQPDGGQVVDPTEAVRRFLEALGVEPQRIPADPDGQAALYRSQLANRRMLIVLDNARDTAQVRPLLPGAPTCLVLVTSRNQLTGLIATDGAHPIPLDLLSAAEARELLAQRLGADRIAAEPGAVAEIRALCAHLPLALALVAARRHPAPGRAGRARRPPPASPGSRPVRCGRCWPS